MREPDLPRVRRGEGRLDPRDLIRRADADYESVGTLGVAAMAVWVGVTLVANGLEGGAELDALMGSGDPSVARALTMGYLLILFLG